jgi:hypothetical protein
MADRAYTSEQDFFNNTGQKDFSQVQVLAPGQTPTGQYYRYSNDPTVKENGAYDPTAAANSALAKTAGTAGLGLDDLRKLLTETVSPDQKNKIYSDLGIPGLETSAFQTAPSTQQLYTDAYNAAGLADLKKQADQLTKDIAAKKDIKNQILTKVDENPWLSEASRLGRTKTDTEAIDREITNLIDQGNNVLSMYDRGVNEVNNLVARGSTDFANEQAVNQAKLQYLLSKAEGQISDLQTANEAKLARYVPDYLSGAVNSKAPDTITAGDGSTFRWDANQGKFVLLAGPKPASPGGGGSGGGTSSVVSPDMDARVKQIIAANPGEYGHAADQIDAKFGKGTATKYDSWLRGVYLYGQDINNIATGKPATDAQYVSSGYANRLLESNSVIDSLQNSIAGYNQIGFYAQKALPPKQQSETIQRQSQAELNFVNAVLRKESGAAISQSEYDNAAKQYFPRPGDTAATLAQKAKNRQTAIQTMIRASGGAFQPPSGGSAPNSGGSNDPLTIR